MTTNKQQEQSRGVIGFWVSLLSLISGMCVAQQDNNQQAEERAPWYQVEVVIFTQQGYSGEEQPPRTYHLDFAENSVELVDAERLREHNFPLATSAVISLPTAEIIPAIAVDDLALMAPVSPADLTQYSEEQTLEEQNILDEYDLAMINADDAIFLAENLTTTEQVYIPEYEKTFVKLQRDVRNLNESSAALDRQRQYNVVFHEAWRFQADDNGEDPWVLIKAGKPFLDRFELEGSLRFYKSRFLHFQSDLWLLEFDQQGDSTSMVELPEFPVQAEPTLSDQHIIGEIQFDPAVVANFFIGAAANIESSNSELSNSESEMITIESMQRESVETVEQPRQYPLKSLWTFDQSKRLEEQQSYYIDHPKMGILLTIIPYQPEPLNPLPAETLPDAQ